MADRASSSKISTGIFFTTVTVHWFISA